MVNKITGKRIDYSSMTKLPNIDALCDVLAMTQKEMGLTPTVMEAEYSKDNKKIRRFKRNSDGVIIDHRTGNPVNTSSEREYPNVSRMSDNSNKPNIRILKNSENDESMKEKQVNKDIPPKHESLLESGFTKWYNRTFGEYDDDDDDDEYICEYCTDLGYSNKYKAHICDNCTKCEVCSEYQNNSCDGCSYSKTRTGKLYSESLSIDQIVDADDLELLRDSEVEDHTKRRSMNNFSILNY